MQTLLIFDSSINITRDLDRFFKTNDTVYLFPLTSRCALINSIQENLKEARCNLFTVQSAKIINSSSDKLRDKYIQFIATLPDRIRHKDKNLKEFFAIDKYATLWWFSLVSEKNVYKSDAFIRLAQLDSIVDLIKEKKIEKVIFGCRSKKLEEALLYYTFKNYIDFITLPIRVWDSVKFFRILKFQKLLYFKHILLILNFAKNLAIRIFRIKSNLVRLKRLSFQDAGMLIITPYPNMALGLAREGIFKNRFYPYLQEALESEGQNIIWIAAYVANNSISFRDSLKYAGQFIKKGTMIFFLEEFVSVGLQIKAFIQMLLSGFKYLRIEEDVSQAHTFEGYNFYPLLKEDWYSSFAGITGYSGLLYYELFKSILNRFKVRQCLYLCEMHAWEKSLMSAKASTGSKMSLYGYQSTTISRMLLNFFNDSNEIKGKGPYALPKPDKIICNGKLVYQYLRDSGWPEQLLSIGEAIRYNYLKEFSRVKLDKKKNIILFISSISPEESSSVLTITYEALKDIKDKEVWLKPHPFLNLKRVFEFSGISEKNFPFQTKTGPIEHLLSEARVVIVGESTAALEALVFGCEVIIVNVPEWINMSPLRHIENGMVKTVNSAEELRGMIINIFDKEYNPRLYRMEAKKALDNYFYFNKDSDVPDRFLKILKEATV